MEKDTRGSPTFDLRDQTECMYAARGGWYVFRRSQRQLFINSQAALTVMLNMYWPNERVRLGRPVCVKYARASFGLQNDCGMKGSLLLLTATSLTEIIYGFSHSFLFVVFDVGESDTSL